MTYVYRDGDTCQEHGFVLSPDGTCLRCRNEALAAERRTLTWKLAGVAAVLSILLGGAAWGHARAAGAASPPTPVVALAPPLPPPPPSAPVTEEIPRSPVTAADTHAVLDAWEAELAKAEARRAQEEAANAAGVAAIERRRREDALAVTPSSASVEGRLRGRGGAPRSSADDHPSWWQEDAPSSRRYASGSLAAQQRAMESAGVAPYNVTNPSAWLPPNNGGNFPTRSPSSR